MRERGRPEAREEFSSGKAASEIIDCEQSLFSSKIRGKERKTGKRASVTVSVTWERRCCRPLVAWALGDD